MKLQLATNVCGQCGLQFPSGEIVGGYGRFLLRSEGTGRPAVVDTFGDPAFEEISQLTEGLSAAADLAERRRGELVRFLFGATADPDPDGFSYGINVPARCPVCGSGRIADWRVNEPASFVEVDLPSVSHRRWDSLSSEAKLREAEAAARDFLLT
jgi:hypothetical protein